MNKGAKGGGIRPPDYVYEMALGRIEELMLQAYSWREIFAKLVTEGFTESEETARNWRREIMRRWKAEDDEMRPAYKDRWRARLETMFRTLCQEAAEADGHAKAILYGEAIKVAKLSIVMDGVQAPVVVQHEGRVDVAAMTPAERQNEIAALLAKREAALKAKTTEKGSN